MIIREFVPNPFIESIIDSRRNKHKRKYLKLWNDITNVTEFEERQFPDIRNVLLRVLPNTIGSRSADLIRLDTADGANRAIRTILKREPISEAIIIAYTQSMASQYFIPPEWLLGIKPHGSLHPQFVRCGWTAARRFLYRLGIGDPQTREEWLSWTILPEATAKAYLITLAKSSASSIVDIEAYPIFLGDLVHYIPSKKLAEAMRLLGEIVAKIHKHTHRLRDLNSKLDDAVGRTTEWLGDPQFVTEEATISHLQDELAISRARVAKYDEYKKLQEAYIQVVKTIPTDDIRDYVPVPIKTVQRLMRAQWDVSLNKTNPGSTLFTSFKSLRVGRGESQTYLDEETLRYDPTRKLTLRDAQGNDIEYPLVSLRIYLLTYRNHQAIVAAAQREADQLQQIEGILLHDDDDDQELRSKSGKRMCAPVDGILSARMPGDEDGKQQRRGHKRSHPVLIGEETGEGKRRRSHGEKEDGTGVKQSKRIRVE